jgi:predicted membrane GTPase involved in stress response
MEKAYSIDKLQDRGKFFVEPNAEIYEGQVIGENSGDDICVNVTKEKNNLTFVHQEMMRKQDYSSNYFLFEEA